VDHAILKLLIVVADASDCLALADVLRNQCKGARICLVGLLAADMRLPDLAADLVVYEIQACLCLALDGIRYWR
jgi:hypothetical protein